MRHSMSPVHLKALAAMKEKEKQRIEGYASSLKKSIESAGKGKYQITSRVIGTVYAAVKADISLEAHGSLINLQKAQGLDMGHHHYERTSATRMMLCISKYFHESSINHLLSDNIGPISIIVDSSVDNSVRNKLIVYLRAMENNKPKVYFYRLLEIEESETSDAFFQMLYILCVRGRQNK